MIRNSSILSAGLVAACVLATTAAALAADETLKKTTAPAATTKPADSAKSPAAKVAPAKPKRELSPALATLRDNVRAVLAMHFKQPLNTRDDSPTEILSSCLAFGCNAEVVLVGNEEQRINGITCLCWNYPCNGYTMMGLSQGHVAPRIGYGTQERPGEFLAVMALSRVPPDYPVRSGRLQRSIADVVTAEQLACRKGNDLSLPLIGLSYYVEEPEWKNDLGETWTLEQIVRQELARPVATGSEDGMNQLLGLSYAVARRAKHNQPLDGQFQRAETFITDFHRFALTLQNSDGGWGPLFLANRSIGPDSTSDLRVTGRIAEWLAISLSDKRLEEERVAKSIECLTALLGSQRYQANLPALSTRELAAVGHALHALAVYDERVFRPADPAPGEKPAATANHDTDSPAER